MSEEEVDVARRLRELSGSPPPWILGHRGAPREAPENTRASLARALELGLDGFEYDLRACQGGEAVLLHDATLDRTTDASGPLASRSLPELVSLDAGGWFARRFEGEGLPLFREVLADAGESAGEPPFQMIELKERGLVGTVARALGELRPPPAARIASFLRSVVLEAVDAGLQAMLLADHASEEDRQFVRDHRVHAYGVGPDGWRTPAGAADWSFCERWAWAVDEPRDLVEACDGRLFGFNTNEPARALATRALARLTAERPLRYPLDAPPLVVRPEALAADTRTSGEWYGHWRPRVRVHNPFGFEVAASADLFVRAGAFRTEGLPWSARLAPGEERDVDFELVGGARAPGGDPLLGVKLRWWPGPGREAGELTFDAPLRRVRSTTVDGMARRLEMLVEERGQPPASVSARRTGGDLILSLESPGELTEAHLVARLGREVVRGGRGLRLRLPADFDQLADEGYPFTCGIEGRLGDGYGLRRWAGGLPEGLGNGRPGLVFPRARA